MAYPGIFQIVYSLIDSLSNILSLSPAAQAELHVVAPKILGALCATIGDVYTMKFARKFWGQQVANDAVRLSLARTKQ